MTLSLVRLELARDPKFPDGSSRHGYEFKAPLDAQGLIDHYGWKAKRKRCTVRRFWNGEDDEEGHLVRHRGGWAFHYDIEGDPEADEPGYRFDSHPFKVGEYVSLKEQDGALKTFRIVSVKPLVI